jgi:high potential iron-sulfur protein
VQRESKTMATSTASSLIRRALIKMVIGGGTVAVIGVAANHRLHAGDKMAKQDVDYQDSPKGIQMCATCSLFDAPTSCKIVEGDISPNGWCKSYAIAD